MNSFFPRNLSSAARFCGNDFTCLGCRVSGLPFVRWRDRFWNGDPFDFKATRGVTENMKKNKGSDKSLLDPLCWPIRRATESLKNDAFEGKRKLNDNVDGGVDYCKLKIQRSKLSELEMMKERFAKLLLGEDMSGSGKGVFPALAISNAVTNLCATVFGQLSRLEPLHSEKKAMWEREIEWLVCVAGHIVELVPSCQTFPDGTKVEPNGLEQNAWQKSEMTSIEMNKAAVVAKNVEVLAVDFSCSLLILESQP